jgi:hypothetical protein
MIPTSEACRYEEHDNAKCRQAPDNIDGHKTLRNDKRDARNDPHNGRRLQASIQRNDIKYQAEGKINRDGPSAVSERRKIYAVLCKMFGAGARRRKRPLRFFWQPDWGAGMAFINADALNIGSDGNVKIAAISGLDRQPFSTWEHRLQAMVAQPTLSKIGGIVLVMRHIAQHQDALRPVQSGAVMHSAGQTIGVETATIGPEFQSN